MNTINMGQLSKKIEVLFVCMGNICRSPSAEAVMNAYIKRDGLSDKISCDSAGTISFHEGNPADARMQKHAIKRNYTLTSISRQIKPEDFERFDYIVCMDEDNVSDVNNITPDPDLKKKIHLMTDFCSELTPGYVPDPYYGGAEGFEHVLDLLEDGCNGLLKHIRNEHNI